MSSSSPHAPGSSPGPTPTAAPLPASNTPTASLSAGRDRDRYASTGDQDDHDQSHLSVHGHGSLQPRPILKSERNLSRSSAHLRWDEDTIKLHDAERGTRMKIDEPKTPWTRADHSLEQINQAGGIDGGGGIPPLDLLDAMDVDPKDMVPSVVRDREAAEAAAATATATDEWSDDEEQAGTDDELDEEAIEHKRQFEKMRSQHYNMKEALQRAKWLVEHEDAQDEDEDEDEDDEDNGDESDSEIKIRVPPIPPLPTSTQKQ